MTYAETMRRNKEGLNGTANLRKPSNVLEFTEVEEKTLKKKKPAPQVPSVEVDDYGIEIAHAGKKGGGRKKRKDVVADPSLVVKPAREEP